MHAHGADQTKEKAPRWSWGVWYIWRYRGFPKSSGCTAAWYVRLAFTRVIPHDSACHSLIHCSAQKFLSFWLAFLQSSLCSLAQVLEFDQLHFHASFACFMDLFALLLAWLAFWLSFLTDLHMTSEFFPGMHQQLSLLGWLSYGTIFRAWGYLWRQRLAVELVTGACKSCTPIEGISNIGSCSAGCILLWRSTRHKH